MTKFDFPSTWDTNILQGKCTRVPAVLHFGGALFFLQVSRTVICLSVALLLEDQKKKMGKWEMNRFKKKFLSHFKSKEK